jgi:hypothetical protein
MISMSVSVDVPNLADGVRFYTEAFGFSKTSEPIPGVVVLRAGTAEICLLEKRIRLCSGARCAGDAAL